MTAPASQQLNLNELGNRTMPIKITKVTEGEGKSVGYLNIEGTRDSVRYWIRDKGNYAKELTEGAEAEATIEVKETVVKNGARAGQTVVEAWLVSFGGPTKVAEKPQARKGGGFAPKSAEEIHAASFAGIVKSAIEKGKDTSEIAQIAELGILIYNKAVDCAKGGKPFVVVESNHSAPLATQSPARTPAQPTEPKIDPATESRIREIGGWFASIGTPEQFKEVKRICQLLSEPWVDVLSAYRADDNLPDEEAGGAILADLGRRLAGVSDYRKDDPAANMTGEEARAAYYAIAERFGWPDFAVAGAVCCKVWSDWAETRITDASRVLDEQWRKIFRGAFRVKAGEEEPQAFATWKRQRLEKGPNPPNGN